MVTIAAGKADSKAKGVKRRHGCACPSVLCPVVAARQLKVSRQGADDDEPLVVNIGGEMVTKDEVTSELRAFAEWLGDRDLNITGHSM